MNLALTFFGHLPIQTNLLLTDQFKSKAVRFCQFKTEYWSGSLDINLLYLHFLNCPTVHLSSVLKWN